MPPPSVFVWWWRPVQAVRTERRWGQKSLITLEVWADRGVRGQKSKVRSRVQSGLGGEAQRSPGSAHRGRAAEPGGRAHSHPGGKAPGRGRCPRPQLGFVRLHPGENPFFPTSAWGPWRCRQLKAAGREERGAEQGAEVGRGKDELCSACPLWFSLRDDVGCLELGSQCERDAQLCSINSKGNQGEKQK